MSTRSLLNRLFTVAALTLTVLLILTALPLASTAAPRLEPRPPESLTALNSTEATECGHRGHHDGSSTVGREL